MLNSKKAKPYNSLHLRPYNAQCGLNQIKIRRTFARAIIYIIHFNFHRF